MNMKMAYKKSFKNLSGIMEIDHPPACNSKEFPDGKLKSNWEWPYNFVETPQ